MFKIERDKIFGEYEQWGYDENFSEYWDYEKKEINQKMTEKYSNVKQCILETCKKVKNDLDKLKEQHFFISKVLNFTEDELNVIKNSGGVTNDLDGAAYFKNDENHIVFQIYYTKCLKIPEIEDDFVFYVSVRENAIKLDSKMCENPESGHFPNHDMIVEKRIYIDNFYHCILTETGKNLLKEAILKKYGEKYESEK